MEFGKKFRKEFDSEPVYNEKYLKAKIKSYNRKINTNFHNNKIPKKDAETKHVKDIKIFLKKKNRNYLSI